MKYQRVICLAIRYRWYCNLSKCIQKLLWDRHLKSAFIDSLYLKSNQPNLIIFAEDKFLGYYLPTERLLGKQIELKRKNFKCSDRVVRAKRLFGVIHEAVGPGG